MSKHTTGPWTLTTVPTSCGACHKIGPFPATSHIRKEVHACVYVDGYGLGQHNAATQELLANARLIAAAPDLLEALKLLLEDTQHKTHDCGDACCPVGIARAALAKATGNDSREGV